MTPAQAKDVGSELIHLLTQQRLLYSQLQELALKQRNLVDGSNPEMLLRVLAGRQRLIDRLTEINRQLKPIRDDWQKIAQSLPPTQRAQAQKLVANVQEILREIITRDKQDSETMQSQHQKITAEIRNTSTGKLMNNAYRQNQPAPKSRFFDIQSP